MKFDGTGTGRVDACEHYRATHLYRSVRDSMIFDTSG